MKKRGRIVSYSADELLEMQQRGETETDWARVRAMTEVELEAATASDPEEAGMVVDWSTARVVMPEPKKTMTIRLDADVLDFFQKSGRGYQTRINAVLRSYMEQTKS